MEQPPYPPDLEGLEAYPYAPPPISEPPRALRRGEANPHAGMEGARVRIRGIRATTLAGRLGTVAEASRTTDLLLVALDATPARDAADYWFRASELEVTE